MSSAKEFREFANECFGWAKTARTDSERDIFLQMATAWIEAARLAAGDISCDLAPPNERKQGRVRDGAFSRT
jgi:hypothetical protein